MVEDFLAVESVRLDAGIGQCRCGRGEGGVSIEMTTEPSRLAAIGPDGASQHFQKCFPEL